MSELGKVKVIKQDSHGHKSRIVKVIGINVDITFQQYLQQFKNMKYPASLAKPNRSVILSLNSL